MTSPRASATSFAGSLVVVVVVVVVVCRLEVDLLLTDLATRVVCAFAREFLRVSVINLSIYQSTK